MNWNIINKNELEVKNIQKKILPKHLKISNKIPKEEKKLNTKKIIFKTLEIAFYTYIIFYITQL